MLDLTQFRNPALQFSGGKDSLACLELYREQLDYLTVYNVNTGDQPPEIQAIIRQVRLSVPRFVEVRTDSKAWRKEHGAVSDVIPASTHFLGRAYGLSDFPLSNRFDCCANNLMKPLHERMLVDGVDCVIRGTKKSDTGQVPAAGATPFYWIELPVIGWSHDEVQAFLARKGYPVNPIYKYAKTSAPECLTCTAWWNDGKAGYLREHHPAIYHTYTVQLSAIRALLREHLVDLDSELS